MTAALGDWALTLALMCAVVQGMPLLLHGEASRLLAMAKPCARMQFALLSLSFGLLIYARVVDDFSVVNVAEHSNTGLPLLYKIVGAWGNHEGSMLLWCWMLALFGACMNRGGSLLENRAQAMQGLLGVGAVAFLLYTSSPFARLTPAPVEGADLNPLLQDIGLALHPPLLYVGYIGFSTVYSFAIAGLMEGRMEGELVRLVQRWALVAWSFLTLGIGLGSWWAYRELGWGGYWFWDPVENASLLPWLAGGALIHANACARATGAMKGWVLLLAVLSFAMSLLGTFLVRSGLVVSVHSFASDPARGVYLLLGIALYVGAGLWLFAVRAGRIQSEQFVLASRAGLVALGNLLFVTALFTVLLGTLYPLAMDALELPAVSVGPAYYMVTFLPLMGLSVALAGVALFFSWRGARNVARHLQWPAVAALAAIFLALVVAEHRVVAACAGLAASAWLVAASVRYAWVRKFRRVSIGVSLAHAGAGLLVLGVTGMGLWQQGAERLMKPGESFTLGNYAFHYVSESEQEGSNFTGLRARLEVRRGDAVEAELSPAFRFYPARRTGTSEASIAPRLFGDIYAVLGEPTLHGTAVRVYVNPLVYCLWLGCVLMTIGGLMALRRTCKE